MEIKRFSGKYKNSKVLYYLKNYGQLLLPTSYFRKGILEKNNASINPCITDRVAYYIRLEEQFTLDEINTTINSLKGEKRNTYFFDLIAHTRYFKSSLKLSYLFGDITWIPETPTLLKSRPILDNNENAVLIKLNKIRHFLFINDKNVFVDKKDMLVSRGKVHPKQTKRVKFLERYFKHSLCDIGKVNANELNPAWMVNRMTIAEQLKFDVIDKMVGNFVVNFSCGQNGWSYLTQYFLTK